MYGGDTNSIALTSLHVFIMKNFFKCYMCPHGIGFTSYHDSLKHKSYIDHMFITKRYKEQIVKYEPIEGSDNLSYHLPVKMLLRMDFQCVTDASIDTDDIDGREGFASLHWSMENIQKYYDVTGRLQTGFVDQNLCEHCNNGCESMEHFNAVNILYDNLVNNLNKFFIKRCGNFIHNHKNSLRIGQMI